MKSPNNRQPFCRDFMATISIFIPVKKLMFPFRDHLKHYKEIDIVLCQTPFRPPPPKNERSLNVYPTHPHPFPTFAHIFMISIYNVQFQILSWK